MRPLPFTTRDELASSRRWVVSSMLGLMALGLVAGYSANVVPALREGGAGADLDFLSKHLTKTLIALVAFLAALRVGPRTLYKAARPAWLVGVALLVAVLFVGKEWNNARRWFSVGGTSFQPSEVARVATIIMIGAWMASVRDRACEYLHGVVVPFALAAVPAVLVLIEPDFGSSVLLLFLGVLAVWVGGARSTHLCVTFMAALAVASVYGWSRLGHVSERLDGFAEPAPGSQVWQSLTALGHGGLTGTGLGAGSASWGFLPEADSDFIFAVVGEELGLLGSLVVLALYAAFLWHGVRILLGMRSRFSLVVGTGLLMQVVLQAVLNVAVVTASVPPKGLPLPFVSLGGTSLLVLCASVGLLLGLASRPEEDPVGQVRPVEMAAG